MYRFEWPENSWSSARGGEKSTDDMPPRCDVGAKKNLDVFINSRELLDDINCSLVVD